MEVGAEPVVKTCDVIETDVICVPPITTTPLDGLRSLFSRKARGDAAGCGTAGCDGACGAARCGVTRAGWFGRLTRGGGAGVKCVESLGTREYECGTRRTYDWRAVRVDACGRPIVEAGEQKPAAEQPEADGDADGPGPGENPPPAPTPDDGDGPAEEVPSADSDDAGRSPVPPKAGVAGQAIDR